MTTLLCRLAGAVAALMALSITAEAQAPIRIGASLSLTGTYGKIGLHQKEG